MSNPQHEPTMEEILASIRKIISEDQPEPAAAKAPEPPPPAPPPAPEPPPVFDTEVLELTEEVKEDGTVQPVSTAAVEPPRHYENDVQFQAIEEPPEAQQEQAMNENDDLISDSTRNALDRVIGTIDEPAAARAAPPVGGSLEAIFVRAVQDAFDPTLQQWVNTHQRDVYDNLKPIIREWMDENLPPLIEAAVQKEIARAVQTRRRR